LYTQEGVGKTIIIIKEKKERLLSPYKASIPGSNFCESSRKQSRYLAPLEAPDLFSGNDIAAKNIGTAIHVVRDHDVLLGPMKVDGDILITDILPRKAVLNYAEVRQHLQASESFIIFFINNLMHLKISLRALGLIRTRFPRYHYLGVTVL
jgi:hypothetical protein